MHKQSPLRRLALTTAACAALGVAATVQAGPTLTVTGWAAPAPGYQSVSVGSLIPSIAYSGAAGGFTGTYDLFGPDPFLFWCYELTQTFNWGQPYTDYFPTSIAEPANTALSELFTEVGGPSAAAASVLKSVAFQLAVWEIKYESAGPYDLFSGNFKTGDGHNATTDLAQDWLTHLPSTQAYTVTFLHSESSQDFVTATRKPAQQVPEPSPLLLLSAGLAAMLTVTRRWNGKQA